ncbi:MAG: hypothetical protein RIQ41_97 [Candidatus Parcubacteria bacterium]
MLRNFSGYPISGLWNIATTAEAPYVSCPPDFIDQEDGLSAYLKIPYKGFLNRHSGLGRGSEKREFLRFR